MGVGGRRARARLQLPCNYRVIMDGLAGFEAATEAGLMLS